MKLNPSEEQIRRDKAKKDGTGRPGGMEAQIFDQDEIAH